ncbi:MAG: hypothetical protein ACM3YE_00420 [Bacteroidota bacterium]
MKAETFAKIEAQLQEIDTQLTDLDLKNDFKKIIHEDLDLAKTHLKERNVLGVINCLLVIVGKVHSHILAGHCPSTAIEQFLICIHRLLQVLIKCPVVIVGPTGATGASGPMGPEGKPGPKGATGATGPVGKDGAVGGIGATGATGPMGPEGKPGPKGAIGATGPAGKDGVAGGIGATGATGPMGPEGPPGPEGPMGATGPAGTTHIISSCTIPVCEYPVEKKEPVKSRYFDDGIHYQFICKPKNPFHS